MGPCRSQGGQALVEFALVAPILVFAFFLVLEGGLVIFTLGAYRCAAARAAIVDAELGNASGADTQAVQAIQASPGLSLGTVTEIDVQCETSSLASCPSYPTPNRYRPDGTLLNAVTCPGGSGSCPPWPPANRNVHNGFSDFFGLTIRFQYQWNSGNVLSGTPLQLTQTFSARLEPQTY